MHSNAHIVMSREKLVVMPESDDGFEAPLFEIKSNRTAFTMSNGNVVEDLVVRGQNLPGTIRMTSMAIDAFTDDREIFRKSDKTDWRALWNITRSQYDSHFNPKSWAAIYVNGDAVFSNISTDEMDAIEQIAQGGDVTSKIARKAARRLAGRNGTYDVDHDSQIAVVFSVVKSQFKISILQRQGGSTKSFAFKVLRNKETVPVATVLNIAADVIESMNLSSFISRVQDLAWAQRIEDASVTADRVAAAVSRYRELLHFVVGYETAHEIEWFPDKPDFLQVNRAKADFLNHAAYG